MNSKHGMVEKIYYFGLKLKMPNDKGKSLDFRTKINDINYAVHEFNRHFQGDKIIKLDKVEDQTIYLYLGFLIVDALKPNISAKELVVFSRKLYYDKNWSEYSREQSKLLGSTEFEDVSDKMSTTFESLPVIPSSIFRNISFPINNTINEELTDAQAVQAFQSLIVLQSIGDEETQKLRKIYIEKIKTILFEVLK